MAKARTPEYRAAYYQAHREERLLYQAEYYRKNKRRLLPIKRANNRIYRWRQKRDAIYQSSRPQ